VYKSKTVLVLTVSFYKTNVPSHTIPFVYLIRRARQGHQPYETCQILAYAQIKQRYQEQPP